MNFLKNEYGDHYIHEVNGSVFNQLGSAAFYHAHFKDVLFRQLHFYLILGTDSGLLPRFIQKTGVPAGTYYLFVELDELIDKVKSNPDLEPLGDQVLICSYSEWEAMAKAHWVVNFISLDQFSYHGSIGSLDLKLDKYLQLSNQVSQDCHQLNWSTNVSFCAYYFVQEQLKNLAENRVPANCLRGALSGESAIILAGGPSLDQSLDWVAENRTSLFVVAVSRISRRLQEKNITPDLIVSIDPSEKMFDVSKEILDFDPPPLLVNAYHVVSTLLGSWSGQSVYMGPRYPWDKLTNIDVMGPTVTNSAIHLLIKMGCSEILLAGVDLCYSQSGYTHAKGSAEHDAGPILDFIGQRVTLNDGTTGETDAAFFAAITAIEQQAAFALNKGCRLINLSEKAAYMKDVIFKKLEDVVLKPVSKKSRRAVSQSVPRYAEGSYEQFLRKTIKELLKADQSLNAIIKLSRRAFKHADNLTKTGTLQQVAAKEINEIEKHFKGAHKPFVTLIKLFGYRHFVEIYHVKKKDDLTEEQIQQMTRVSFQAHIHAANDLKASIRMARERIRARIEELAFEPDFECLFKQWASDGQFSRASCWQRQHSELFKALSESTREGFQKLDQAFRQQLQPAPMQEDKQADPEMKAIRIQGKLLYLFRQKDTAGLRYILDGLSASAYETSIFASLSFLAAGYLLELNGNTDDAVKHYYSASQGISTELALNHLASLLLSKHDPENARVALECLSHLSLGYLPWHAKICHLLGMQEEAVQHYRQYLKENPEDAAVKRQLEKCLT